MPLDDLIGLGLIGILLFEAGCTVVAGLYVRWVNGQRKEESRYLDMLISRDTRVALGCGALTLLTVFALVRVINPGIPPLPQPWGAIWLVVSLVPMMWGPISDALQFRRDRRIDAPTETAP